MEEIGLYKCSQSDCSIFQDGKCVNGLPDCKNKIKIVINDLIEENNFPIEHNKYTTVIPWGDNFTDANLSFLTFKHNSKLILLLGEPSAGKSTLYAALFDSFNKGKCGEYFFAGTKTPIGFENICHLAREKSRGKVPKTERTKSYEFTYFHLVVRKSDFCTPAEHLIFADVNGERFQDVRDSDEETRKLTILKRADQIFFIADGGLLIDNIERHATKDSVWKTIKRCIHNGMIPANKKFHLIITKWDEITAAGKTKDVYNFFIAPTTEQFRDLISNQINIASRSLNDEVPSRLGIDEFLKQCLEPSEKNIPEIYKPQITREYQRFKYEYNGRT